MKYVLLLALPFSLTALLTPLWIKLSPRLGLLDLPDERRKLHTSPVPTAGGVVIVLGFMVSLAVNQIAYGQDWSVPISLSLGLGLGCLLLGILGAYDDAKKVGPWVKIIVQLIGGLIIYSFGLRVQALTHPFGDQVSLSFLSLPATLLWVLVITNAVNLIDGVDGLAGGIVIIALATLSVVSYRAGEAPVLFYAGMLGAALAGFYLFNFPPAKVFLGDAGSLFLGFALAALSLIENRKGTTTLALLVPILAMGVPLLDAGLAFLRRSRNGVHPFTADRQHLHHRLLRLGLTPRQVVMVFVYVSLYLGFSASLMALLPKTYVFMMIIILALGVLVAMAILSFLEKRISALERRNGDGSDQ